MLLQTTDFFQNGFAEFIEFSDKNLQLKRLFKPGTSCVANWSATTVPARNSYHAGSLNWSQFVFQWCVRFPEFTELKESSAQFGKILPEKRTCSFFETTFPTIPTFPTMPPSSSLTHLTECTGHPLTVDLISFAPRAPHILSWFLEFSNKKTTT